MEPLWGKHKKHGITLLRHTLDVVEAGDALFGTVNEPTRLGECWLRFFKLPRDTWGRFYWNLLAAELLHDWGKANDGMQRVLTGRGEQAIRHEHFSALLIAHPTVWNWLGGRPELDREVILSAVLTHHLKASGRADGWATIQNGLTTFRLEQRETGFAALVTAARSRLTLTELDLTSIPERWSFGRGGENVRDHRERIQDHILEPFRKRIGKDKSLSPLLTAVRAALIAADAAGSGYARVRKAVEAEVWRQFVKREPWTSGSVWAEIICKRVADLNEKFKKQDKPPFEWNPFQIACDNLPGRALLLAACGRGKTLAAWRWIAAQAGRRPVGRVLFLYPTRATAKEGFRDYVSWAPEADAALMHGNAAFDLHGMFDNGDARGDGSKYEADRRLFSLGYWPKRVFSATVDQFLAFLQHGYGPICMLPVLADSVIVIDEVHSFDRNMFSALKAFLENFDVPVLCMTATLPQDRRAELETWLKVYEDKPSTPGERTSADVPRYTLARIDSWEPAVDAVNKALNDGKRVLWVANTVRRCHEITAKFAARYSDLSTANGKPVYCYHSRFKLNDRIKRHDKIVNELKFGRPAALGVTTQVCEMSLDLDVDLLVTEGCPVTSLIQRMGRCNRRQEARPLTESGQVLVYPAGPTPYEANDLKGLDEFLDKTAGRELCQTDLETTLYGLSEIPDWYGDVPAMFLKSGPYASSPKADDEDAVTFREGNDFNRPCVLPGEVGTYLDAEPKLQPGFVVPVPKKLSFGRDDENGSRHTELPNYLGVAADGRYDPLVGYCDRPLTEWGAE